MKKIFIGIIITLIVGAVGYGLYLTGSPGAQRQVRFDERRVSNLQEISRAISSYHTQTGTLPEALTALESLDFFLLSFSDPNTGEAYEYRVISEVTYELCAVFESDSSLTQKPRFPLLDTWEYKAGRHCFSNEVLVKARE